MAISYTQRTLSITQRRALPRLHVISRLLVRTGNLGKLSTSDVWQHFGPLFRKYTIANANV
jgi:hypothetical protein